MMSARVRTFALTAHVTSSVGWLGSVASFLVLGIAGMSSRNAEIVRGAYLSMNLLGQFIIVPLGLAALLTGLVQSLGTPWGLIRHYWVLVKFALTVGATVLLLLHQFTAVAAAARRVSETGSDALPNVGRLGTQLVGDAGLAVLVLLVTTVLSVYKPWGRTEYGAYMRENPGDAMAGLRSFLSVPSVQDLTHNTRLVYMLVAIGLLSLLAILHVTGVIRGH